MHGEVVPDPAWLAALGTVDLISVLNGGTYEDASDRFYSSPTQIILPGTSRKMDDGWENRRRRVRDTNDWVRFRLPAQGAVRAIEIDTAYLKGNSAGWIALQGRNGDTGEWFEILPRTRLSPTPCTASCCAPRPSSPTSASTPSPTAAWPGCGCTAPSRSPARPS